MTSPNSLLKLLPSSSAGVRDTQGNAPSGALPPADRIRRSPQVVEGGPDGAEPAGLTTLDNVDYCVAGNRRERLEAFRLIHDAYTRNGLMYPDSHGIRVTPFHLLPTTTVFNAVHEGRVIYTLSLIRSGELGLPAQSLYPLHIRRIERERLQLAEVTCLASSQVFLGQKRMFKVFVRLVSLMFQFARHHRVDRLLIVVHPKQRKFYEHSLGFRQFGGNKSCPWVRNRPAVGLEHDFALCDQKRYRHYEQVYGHRFSKWELQSRPMPTDEQLFFSAIAESLSHFQYKKTG